MLMNYVRLIYSLQRMICPELQSGAPDASDEFCTCLKNHHGSSGEPSPIRQMLLN